MKKDWRPGSPLALHTGVSLGTLWNHIPRYELEVVLVELLLLLVWKKPSANLPLLETSLSSPASEPPRESVSVAAEHEGACSDKRNSQRTTRSCMAREVCGLEDGRSMGEVDLLAR